jgi:hypothetical protein
MYSNKIISVPIFIFLFFLLPNPINAATIYYASPTGSGTICSDSNPCSLDTGINKLVAGDTLYLKGGTYKQAVTIRKSGTEISPITISNYPNEVVTFDASGLSAYSVIRLSGDWLIAQGFEIKNSKSAVAMLIEGDHGIVRNNRIHDNWAAAIHINGDYGLAENNLAFNNGLVNENNQSGVKGGWPAIVSCVRNYDNPTPEYCTLRGNIVYENWGEGVSVFEQIHATIEDNISYNNQQNIYLSDTKYSLVQRNLSYCTPNNHIGTYHTQNGILVGDEKGVLIDGVRQSSSDNKVYNNMVIGCDRNIAAGTLQSTNNLYAYNTFLNSANEDGDSSNVFIYVAGSCSNCRFINNLIYQGPDSVKPIAIGGDSSWTMANNLWSERPSSLFRDNDGNNQTNDIIADPLMANIIVPSVGNITAENFKLLANSPAINQSFPLSEVTVDFFGTNRGNNPDIGAHEYYLSTTPSHTLQPTSLPLPSPVMPIVMQCFTVRTTFADLITIIATLRKPVDPALELLSPTGMSMFKIILIGSFE